MGNRVTFLHDGDACFTSMLDAIAGAEHEVLLEMYWFGSDSVGKRFVEALSARAHAGVSVCIVYDALGSWDSDTRIFAELRRAGCHVHEFNPIRPWARRFKLERLNQRDHRKMLIIDGCTGMTGGVNLADAWLPPEQGGEGWRDDMIRVDGPAVADMRRIFLHTFEALGGNPPKTARVSRADIGHSRVRVLANDTRRHRLAIENAYLYQIRAATRRIRIVNSYFLPRLAVRRALAAAVRRGVDVRVLLPRDSDVPAAAYATRYLYTWLLTRGIRVHEWQRGMLHAKSAVIDGRWCTVGTHNLDYRSWLYNLEINVAVDDEAVASVLEARLDADFAESSHVDLSHWRYRPLVHRLFEFIAYRFRRLL